MFGKYLQARTEMAYELYKRKRTEAKKEADVRWGSRVMQNLEGNRKIF